MLNWHDFACKFQIPDFFKIYLADMEVQYAARCTFCFFHSVNAHYAKKLQTFRFYNELDSKGITDFLMWFLEILKSFKWGVNSVQCNKNKI